MARGRLSPAHTVMMAVAVLAVAPPHACPITSALAGEIVSVDSPVLSEFSVGETVTATYALDSAAAPTVVSSTQDVHDGAVASFNMTASEGYAASATDGEIAISKNDLTHHDRYRAVIASSPNIEASLDTARSLSPKDEILSGFEPASIVLFLVGIIGSALICLALGRHALTERKRSGRQSKHMTAGNVRRIRHAFMHRHSGTWLAVFLSLLAFAYFLFFGLS